MVVTSEFYNLVDHYKELARGGDLQTRMIYQKIHYWKSELSLVQRNNVVDFLHHLETLEQNSTIVEAIKSFKQFLALTGEN